MQSKRTSTVHSSKPVFDRDHYHQRLEKGESMREILQSATPEEEQFISHNFDLYEFAQQEMEQKNLKNIFANYSSTQEVLSKIDSSKLLFVAENLDTIKEFEKIISNSQSNPKKKKPNSPTNRLSDSQRVVSTASEHAYLDQRMTTSHRVSHQHQQVSEEEEKVDDYSNLRVNFGASVRGKTFRQILENYKNHETWLCWLKKNRNTTSNRELADKAYKYFRKHVPNWDQL